MELLLFEWIKIYTNINPIIKIQALSSGMV